MEDEIFDIEQHKLIVKRADKLLLVVSDKARPMIQKLIDESQSIIDNHNNENLIVSDITSIEEGLFRSVSKKVIYGKYLNPILSKPELKYTEEDLEYICQEDRIYDEGIEGEWWFDYKKLCGSCKKEYLKREREERERDNTIQNIRSEFRDACNDTLFAEDLKNKYVLLSRKIFREWYKLSPLESAVKETIHTEILKTFQEQNQELIIKYL